jgi:hypothetical protein
MTFASLVHPASVAQCLPVVRRAGRGWELLEAPALGSDVPEAALLDVLSDLANYGLVAPLVQVDTDSLLWWPGFPAPGGDLRVPDLNLPGGPSGKFNRVRWMAAEATDDRWRFRVSATARSAVATLGLPVVHGGLLTLVALAGGLPAGDVHVALSGRGTHAKDSPRGARPNPNPPAEGEAFAWPWRADAWSDIRQRGVLLRERRRLALGLPARIDSGELDRLVERHFILPAAQAVIDRATRHARCRIVLHPVLPEGAGTDIDVTVGHYLSDDPVGENVFMLCGSRVRRGAPIGRRLRATGRSLVALADRARSDSRLRGPSSPGWGEAMLAAVQLDFLLAPRAGT